MGIENSHSIATASHDGQVHVWRVELVPTSSSGGGGGASNTTGVAISSAHSSSFDNNTINYYNYTNLNAENAGNSNSATASTDLYNKVSVTARFQGAALVRAVDVSSEGRVLSVHHYNNDISSVVTFATQVIYTNICTYIYILQPFMNIITYLLCCREAASMAGICAVRSSHGSSTCAESSDTRLQ